MSDHCKRDKKCELCGGTMQVECDCECCQQEFGIHNTVTPCKCTNGYQCAGGGPVWHSMGDYFTTKKAAKLDTEMVMPGAEITEVCPACHLELPPKEYANDS